MIFSLLAEEGVLDNELLVHAVAQVSDVPYVNLSRRLNSEQAAQWRSTYPSRTFVRFSDSHSLDTLSRANCTKMYLEAPTFDEIRLALAGKEERRISWPWG